MPDSVPSSQPEPGSADVLRWDQIPSTRWTLVGRAAHAGTPGQGEARSALEELVRLYLPVLRGHLISTLRLRPDGADDLLQGFLAERVVEKNLIARADSTRGRFRRFLLTALNRYVTDVYRRDSASKRQPAGGPPVSLGDIAEQRASQPTAAEHFDRMWANEVLGEVMRRTRAACMATDRKPVWAILEGRILLPVTAGTAPVPHGELARRLGLQDAAQSASFLASGKQLFIQVFRMVVREYMAASQRDDEPSEALDRAIDEELTDLWAIFAARPR